MVDKSTSTPAPADVVPCTDVRGDVLAPPDAGERWAVLQTLSRREKRVVQACERFSVRHYLPLRPGRPATRSRMPAWVPLFPGYVFACMGGDAGCDVLESGGITRILPVRRPDVLLEELRRIRFALDAGLDLSPAASFHRGRRVRVIAGPLQGLLGEVADRRARRGAVRLILNVSLIGRGATVEIDPADVELTPASDATYPARGRRAGPSSPIRPAEREPHSPSGTI